LIKTTIEVKKDDIIDKLDCCIQGKLSENYRDIGLSYTDIQSKTREIKNDIRDNKFVFPYSALPGKEMVKMVKEKIHSEYSLNIAEVEIADNFSEADIPEIIKSALLFFKK